MSGRFFEIATALDEFLKLFPLSMELTDFDDIEGRDYDNLVERVSNWHGSQMVVPAILRVSHFRASSSLLRRWLQSNSHLFGANYPEEGLRLLEVCGACRCKQYVCTWTSL